METIGQPSDATARHGCWPGNQCRSFAAVSLTGHAAYRQWPGYNPTFERQNSAPRREVIGFILYLSINLPDARSTFQSQRVFFTEDATLLCGFPTFAWVFDFQVGDLQHLRPHKIQVSGLASLIVPLQRSQGVIDCLQSRMVLGNEHSTSIGLGRVKPSACANPSSSFVITSTNAWVLVCVQ